MTTLWLTHASYNVRRACVVRCTSYMRRTMYVVHASYNVHRTCVVCCMSYMRFLKIIVYQRIRLLCIRYMPYTQWSLIILLHDVHDPDHCMTYHITTWSPRSWLSPRTMYYVLHGTCIFIHGIILYIRLFMY